MFLLGLALIAIGAPLVAGYDDIFEKFDVDKVLEDDKLFNEHIECFLDQGPCPTDLATEVKKLVPEVIATACEKCTTSEKYKVRKLVGAIYKKKPNKAIEFHKKYDPTGEYEKKFAAFLSAKDD